ncbi:glucan 1,4-alpha-glucosidase [Kaistia algarum]|uniref:glucan 1,4-alpha-glucosidase n=1 Tax=Kaistia algarum TaxID=2083279 RepID=UPI000CE736B5|nr:glucan 1,4-alpha-glucosidase [Kaistia algarum]MCX5514339.1 glucan 1,4-alpha-glucosidase [Kaistia algarum]PPE79090.1 glucan 1,4-alpha-glucosidase [Kaistia algarum]
MSSTSELPPGAPGLDPRWTSSAKSGVGTAMTAASRIWFTLSHGILNEIYYPRVDAACTRDFGLVVAGPDGYFSEEKRDADHEVSMMEEGVPAFRLSNTARDRRYRIEKEILTDPRREALLQRITFEALEGELADYRLYALLSPHLVNAGANNTAWVGDYKGTPMLFASGPRGVSVALACSVPWLARSVGFVGASDGWQNLSRGEPLNQAYQLAEHGNVALSGEIDLTPGKGHALLALGFGVRPDEAGYRALSSLQDGFESARKLYAHGWRAWQDSLLPLDRPAGSSNLNRYRISTAVLATHQPTSFPGAAIASLSIPWGFSKGDEDLGGYHLVWPRDLVETAGGFLAAGATAYARDILAYLMSIQEEDGHWSQNVWLDGTPYWSGVQMDECAFPLLLADMLHRSGHLERDELARFLPMIEKAARYVAVNGPVTAQDRWEEDAGYSPFTLAVEIAGLLAAADLMDTFGRKRAARYLRETADSWNDDIEYWTFAKDTELAQRLGISGYYVRIAAPETADAASPLEGFVPVKNRPPSEMSQLAAMLISPDALALVRFGLRAPDDPRILDTIAAIDATLRAELPQGPIWYRYNGDGYGEHEDGAPFNGVGIGRPWPLLSGERAHYELAAGRIEVAEQLLTTLEESASIGGLLPEQVWDATDIPERELFHGRPSGSAMPLVWAHSEHIKLLRSLRDGAVFDMPPQTVERYQKRGVTSPVRSWRFCQKIRTISGGKSLRIELQAPAIVHWTTDDWATIHDTPTAPNDFGIDLVTLPTSEAAVGTIIRFTLYWPQADRWENADFAVTVDPARSPPPVRRPLGPSGALKAPL